MRVVICWRPCTYTEHEERFVREAVQQWVRGRSDIEVDLYALPTIRAQMTPYGDYYVFPQDDAVLRVCSREINQNKVRTIWEDPQGQRMKPGAWFIQCLEQL